MNQQNEIREQKRIPRIVRIALLETNLSDAKVLLPFARQVTSDRHARLMILSSLAIPQGDQISVVATKASQLRRELTRQLKEEFPKPIPVKTIVRPESEIWEGIADFIGKEKIDILIAHWNVLTIGDLPDRALTASPLFGMPCEVILLRPSSQITSSEQWSFITKILLPIRGGVNSTLTLRIGYSLARLSGGSITLLHVTSQKKKGEKIRFIEEFSPALYDLEPVTRTITAKGDISTAIIAEAQDHEAIVMGAPSTRQTEATWQRSFLDQVLASPDKTLIIVKEPHFEAPEIEVQKYFPVKEHPLAIIVDEWFAENTYHSNEFADLDRLLAFKKDQGLRISLGLPALNEESTVGQVIQTIKSALMEDYALLDEIVLIDSGSEDRTREIACDLGIPVYVHGEILPECGSYVGKGEALWKSLHILTGDIIAWIDTDIINIHPRFVYGILGPLLLNPRIQYVKGFYQRPIKRDDKIVAGGGGRVTELTARPFINLFFPELSGLIQPLSGEYAGRRSALEKLPFFTGYGVETGLLIDLLEEFGLESIAQVDLLERIHHNQPLPSLSKMSFAIMQVVFRRLERRHNIHLLDHANLTMNLIRFSQRRGYYLEQEEIQEHERPPMIEIPEYREKRKHYVSETS